MELREHNPGSVFTAERASPRSKASPPPEHTAYEAHQEPFERNLWSLIDVYTQRQLSFESDSIHSFSGILISTESKYAPAQWRVPM
jgi:hypothetical protein